MTRWPGARKGVGIAKLPKTNNRYSLKETIITEETINDYPPEDVELFKKENVLWTAQEQKRLDDVAERDNIKQLQKKVDMANAELREAQLKRQNRIMSS